jgi:hypothetical protein
MNTHSRLPVLASLLAVAWLSGCGDHDHASHAPSGGGHKHESAHGGVAVELGEHQFHLDFVVDSAAGTMKAWIMDGHAENFVRVPLPSFEVVVVTGTSTQNLALAAQANTASGETVGDSSQFQGEAGWLKGLTQFNATVPRIEIRGSTFTDVRFGYPAAH